ncbi:hypothetical protein Q5P01_004575 [Channa striata]|uniref:Beta-taxilin n=1 Tax=Channa striata TaxID=64152 RepID=A0AA88NLQ8_CHASR|nr:hypothetical protein Q5P01_004575 [Channa striata]
METSVKPAEVLLPPEADVASSSPSPSSPRDAESARSEAAAASCGDFDPMEEFSRRLEDIVSAYGSASSLLDRQDVMEEELEKMQEEAKEDITVATETEVSLIKQSLNSSSPEEKLDDVVRKFAQLAVLRRRDEKKQRVQQQSLSALQAERHSCVVARSKLEALCRDLQRHYEVLREETLQRCREDEEKRKEMSGHFQQMLTEIQTQIEQHSVRNDKLCRENSNLTDKLESLMNQCELREQSLEKINRHRDLEHKLTEAKLEQANALLAEAEDRHKREKEYLLREAIDKTKKCFAMKEQELAMKKQLLLQAAEWKLQAQTLREQGTVMQAQLTLYGQKFDEFQETLAKSNEIYVRFKKEMENMSDKMKKVEKESNLWKTRFENCNKALTDMIEERTEKGKEYDLFVLKIQRLEKLCRALQDERKVLYEKIKEVRHANSNLPGKVISSSKLSQESDDKSALLTPLELQELQELQETDPVLTEDMTRLREEQAKLQEFAASLLDPVADNEEDHNIDIDLEEDLVSAAFFQFKTKTQVKKEPISVPEEQVVEVKSEAAEPVFPQPDKAEEVQKPDQSAPEEKSSEAMPTDPQPLQQIETSEEIQQQKPTEQVQTPETEDAQIPPLSDPKAQEALVQTPVEDKEMQQVQINEKIQQQKPAEQVPTPEAEKLQINSITDPKSEVATARMPVEDKEVQQIQIIEEIQQQQQQQQKPAEQVPTPAVKEVQIHPPSDQKPVEATILEETGELKPVEPVEELKIQQQVTELLQVSEEAATKTESAPPAESMPKTAASSMKNAPKKKKKKQSGKNVS